jgi:hypothetical protein
MKSRNLIALAALLAANIIGTASVFGDAIANLPNEKTDGAISYLSGGVGADEITAMKQEQSKYPLTMEFVEHAKPKDELLANVAVTIKNNDGKVMLQTMSDGPYLFAKVPDGMYVITAEIRGTPQSRVVNVAAQKSEHVLFEW